MRTALRGAGGTGSTLLAAGLIVLIGSAQAAPFSASRDSGEARYVAAVGPALTPLGATRFCLSYPNQCRAAQPLFRPKRMAAAQDQLRELDAVNRAVNRAIRPQADPPGLINDIWTISPTAGDCDKYAVTKRAKLLERGWSRRSLLLAQVVTSGGEAHLVLVARTRSGDFVLDNLAAAVLPADRAHLRWVSIQSSADPHVWRAAALGARPETTSPLLARATLPVARAIRQVASTVQAGPSP